MSGAYFGSLVQDASFAVLGVTSTGDCAFLPVTDVLRIKPVISVTTETVENSGFCGIIKDVTDKIIFKVNNDKLSGHCYAK